jgi:hypothetical protein
MISNNKSHHQLRRTYFVGGYHNDSIGFSIQKIWLSIILLFGRECRRCPLGDDGLFRISLLIFEKEHVNIHPSQFFVQLWY